MASQYNYVATSNAVSAVCASCTINTYQPRTASATSRAVLHSYLAVAKTSRLEIHLVAPASAGSVQALCDVPVYGRIALMNALTLPDADADLLVFTTERYQFAVLALEVLLSAPVAGSDAAGQTVTLRTLACGDLRDRIGRPCTAGQRMAVDPLGRVIAAHFYEGVLKLVPAGKAFDAPAFNTRLEETDVLDFTFLHDAAPGRASAAAGAAGASSSLPVLAVLYSDYVPSSAPASIPQRHVRTYEVDLKGRALRNGPWKLPNVDARTSVITAVPAPVGGVLLIGFGGVTYVSGTVPAGASAPASLSCDFYTAILPRAVACVDSRTFLVTDAYGFMHAVGLVTDGSNAVTRVRTRRVGTCTLASTLTWLGQDAAFVGSSHADSQLVHLPSRTDIFGGSDAPMEGGVTVLRTFTNIGPIVDMCVMDLDRQGQGQVVTASGAFTSGSIRVVRAGIGVSEQACVDIPALRRMFTLRRDATATEDWLLVLAFATETRSFIIAGAELEETDELLLTYAEETLACANLCTTACVQVTPTSVRVLRAAVDGNVLSNVTSWTPPDARRITLASVCGPQILLALTGGVCVYLTYDEASRSLQQVASRVMPHEIACLDVHTLLEPRGEGMDVDAGAATQQTAVVAAIGLWTDVSVRIVGLTPALPDVAVEMLGGDIQSRSVLLATLEGVNYLFVAMGDGHVYNFKLDMHAARTAIASSASPTVLTDRKKVAVGTQPVTLTSFYNKGKCNVFAACDRPTVLFSASGKLVYSNVNTAAVNFMTPFSSSAYPECLAMASDSALTIGTVDDIQKLHIRTIPLGASPRRIAHHKGTRVIVAAVEDALPDPDGEVVESARLRLFDDVTFDALSEFSLDPHELVQSLHVCALNDEAEEVIVAGTAYMLDDEEEPSRGRILILSVLGVGTERRLHLLHSKDVKGGVLSLARVGSRLVAGINGRVAIYTWGKARAAKSASRAAAADVASMDMDADADTPRQLTHECHFVMNTLVLYLDTRGDFILVGDLMKSISLLRYKLAEGALEEVAADAGLNWMTGAAMLDDATFLGAEHHYNLFTATRNMSAASEEARSRLQIVGEFHLGDQVNRFCAGSLVMVAAEDAAPAAAAVRSSLALDDDDDDFGTDAATAASAAAKKRPRRAGTAADADAAESRASGSSTTAIPRPRLIYGTTGGALGVIISLPAPLYRYLLRVQRAVTASIPSVGALSHSHWRSWFSDRRLPAVTPLGGEDASSSSFIDGDVIEMLLDVTRAQQDKVVAAMNAQRNAADGADAVMHPDGSTAGDAKLEELLKAVEELARLH